MSEFVKLLTRKNSLRKQCQDLTTEDLAKIIADLTDIYEEHKTIEDARIEAEQIKNKKIDAIRKAMEESGIGFDDLKETVPVVAKKKVAAKYRVVIDNISHEWSGRGRTPLVFQQYFDQHNVTKESCLIK
ncbi:H-NS histone family protein [Gammaproteobacteria bacterium AS21]|jgi:DNA-binding protein H-NS